ncbi:MAG: hypothetical protein Q8S19_08050, partial [Bacillota bacterium]|nr:hypothetical protein [Bacillota bacterium]
YLGQPIGIILHPSQSSCQVVPQAWSIGGTGKAVDSLESIELVVDLNKRSGVSRVEDGGYIARGVVA